MPVTDEAIDTLGRWISESHRIVFLGGAGVSTESGIPDFRGAGGLYTRDSPVPPEKILSHGFLLTHPDQFFDFIRANCDYRRFLPNRTHLRLAELEREGRLQAVVTQNIDGLHQRAGSVNVLEIHGNCSRFYCTECGEDYGWSCMETGERVPRCHCGGMIRPDVVLYGEMLDQDVLEASVDAIRDADMLIVGGTSLTVYPAAGLIDYYCGERLVLINATPTPYDDRADLLIAASLGEVFSRV